MAFATKVNPKTIIIGSTLAAWVVVGVAAPWQSLGNTKNLRPIPAALFHPFKN